MEDSRTSTSFKRLASTFDTLIEIPVAAITAIAVVRSEKLSTGNNRDKPVSVQELVYGSKTARVGISPKYLERHHELISSSEEVHEARKDRGACEGLDTHVFQRTSPKDESLVEQPKHVIRGPEEVGPRQGKQLKPPQAKGASTSAKKAQENPKDQPEGQSKGKEKGTAQVDKPYPQNYRISQKEKKAVDNVFDSARTLMKFKKRKRKYGTNLF
ncbi:hypothetical protein O181_092269 [Austropuccinia psidii MF-1]|uniref:Uncharacterized protein n=1 Tax=Austropuccinia psidii MF-1 TaxID=1389203 RepID=A0A9Q3IYY1_9BASI|nr:hypothetical protein [Austropuccinia psidii MF-1]